MPPTDLIAHGEHVMTVCNACRYCEQYCPVFPAMERRQTFTPADLTYLANLCHACGECLYACQYAPPHEFAINVPQTLAAIRLTSYEEYAWPRALAVAYRRSGLSTAIALAVGLTAMLSIAAAVAGPPSPTVPGDFYAVIPHAVMVGLFGAVAAFVLMAFTVGLTRFWRAQGGRVTFSRRAFADMLTLRHLHSSGVDCTVAEEQRTPWRRWFHHATFYGFLLCFASTTVGAIYHFAFGWVAPYDYTSLPVILGTCGGLALLIGPAGLLIMRPRRDPALSDGATAGLDESFIFLLLLASLTGLLLLALRSQPVMRLLLVVHLGVVLALFLTLPYGKFVHALYRTAALLKASRERVLDVD
jgi:citrate/tricarballylate utilization protein